MKRIASLGFAFLISISAVSCGGTAGEDTTDAPVSPDFQTTTAPSETAEPTFADFPSQDFGGAVVKLGDTKQYDIYRYSIREEMNGDVLNDALYEAHRDVEDKLNITLEPVLFDDPGQLANAVLAGEHAADILTGQDLKMANLALEGYMYDITDMDMLDFNAPWWPESALESYYFNDSMLVFSNYMSYFGVSRARVWFINKQLCEDFGMEVPYEDVFNGTWTLDKLNTMIATAYKDVNGNTEVDEADTVGYVCNNNFICMQSSFGVKTYASKDGGELEYIFDVARASAVLDKMYSLLYNTNTVLSVGPVSNQEVQKYFKNGTSLFYYDSLGMAESDLRDSNVEYSILCTPKLDESQEDYIATYTDYSHAVPLTITNPELVGHTIEALTAAGYYKVLPAFIDVCMTNKYVFDEESADVIRLISEKMYVDLAYSFSSPMANSLQTLLGTKSTDIASWFAQCESTDRALMEQLNTLYGN